MDLKLDEKDDLYIFFKGRRYKGHIMKFNLSQQGGTEIINLDIKGIYIDKGWL